MSAAVVAHLCSRDLMKSFKAHEWALRLCSVLRVQRMFSGTGSILQESDRNQTNRPIKTNSASAVWFSEDQPRLKDESISSDHFLFRWRVRLEWKFIFWIRIKTCSSVLKEPTPSELKNTYLCTNKIQQESPWQPKPISWHEKLIFIWC